MLRQKTSLPAGRGEGIDEDALRNGDIGLDDQQDEEYLERREQTAQQLLEKCADLLMEKEKISGEEFAALFS